MTLTDFLLARIAEDEAVTLGEGDWPQVEVALAHDWYRARVLAECGAKRRVVERYLALEARSLGGSLFRAGELTEAVRALFILAKVYAGHPDFQGGWRDMPDETVYPGDEE